MTDNDERPLLNYPHLMLLLLRAAERDEGSVEAALAGLRRSLALAHERLALPEPVVAERLRRGQGYLIGAGLLRFDGEAGRFRLTERGRRVLEEHPQGVDDSVLMAFPEFRAFIGAGAAAKTARSVETTAYDQGYGAFAQGQGLSDNPHDFDSVAHLAWEAGWFEAFDEHEEHKGG